jgi:ferrous iron transport protein A
LGRGFCEHHPVGSGKPTFITDEEKDMTSLTLLENGQNAVVRNLTGGQRFISRASAMGFTPDTPVTMMQNLGRGPVLVYLRDTQVALGRGEAAKIQVERRG